jgi:hypothetical protein
MDVDLPRLMSKFQKGRPGSGLLRPSLVSVESKVWRKSLMAAEGLEK